MIPCSEDQEENKVVVLDNQEDLQRDMVCLILIIHSKVRLEE